MTTTPLRKDSARNWERIVEAGRRHVDAGRPLQLNDVARAASVGVATVYRHFPSTEALMETLAAPGLAALVQQGDRLLTGGGGTALGDFLLAALQAQVDDPAVARVFAASQHALPATSEVVRHLVELFGRLLAEARSAGAIDPQVTQDDLVPLVCGVAYAAAMRTTGGAADRAATVRRYLTVLMNGLRPAGSPQAPPQPAIS